MFHQISRETLLWTNTTRRVHVTSAASYCGFPAATNALMVARKVFAEAERDGKSPGPTTGSDPVQENE
jgi:hypothetical protein